MVVGVIPPLNCFNPGSHPYYNWNHNRKKIQMSEYTFWEDMWNVPSTPQPEENKKDILWNEVGKMPSNSNENNSEP